MSHGYQQIQGPWGERVWGEHGGFSFCDGLGTGIKGLKIKSQSRALWSLSVKYDACGQSFQSVPHGEPPHYVMDLQEDEIKFNFPYEYLQRIEGFIGTAHGRDMESGEVVCVTTLTFKSNIKTYGPYGNPGGGEHISKVALDRSWLFGENHAWLLTKLEYS
ncbi:unnamed protein product [Sphagnum balticum]